MTGTTLSHMAQGSGIITTDALKMNLTVKNGYVGANDPNVQRFFRVVDRFTPEQKKLLSVDKKSDIEKLPEAWKKVILKDNGDIKKIILYNTTVAAFMQSGEKLLAKIEKSLATFKENKDDIALIWRPHPLTMASLKASKPELLNPYVELVEKYCLEQWGIYDDTPSMEMAVALCDAYYGDADGVAHKCETLGKPVMYQNPEI